jgi:hypothetical protein
MTRADYATIAQQQGEAASDYAAAALRIETGGLDTFAEIEATRALWRAALDAAIIATTANAIALGTVTL